MPVDDVGEHLRQRIITNVDFEFLVLNHLWLHCLHCFGGWSEGRFGSWGRNFWSCWGVEIRGAQVGHGGLFCKSGGPHFWHGHIWGHWS